MNSNITGVDKDLQRQLHWLCMHQCNVVSWPGVTEHSQGTYTVMLYCRPCHNYRQHWKTRSRSESIARQNNVQAQQIWAANHIKVQGIMIVTNLEYHPCMKILQCKIAYTSGWKIPQMYDAAIGGKLKAMWLMGEDNVQTDPNTIM
ncbi:MAG: hypothetical protein IPP29_09955 [Bacteroidetes bacterium]|nr:hypothetical protein [Bacteroidota bacterium]